MLIGGIEVMPPAKEWLTPSGLRATAGLADHVALKRRHRNRDWDGYANAILTETVEADRRWLPGGYITVPVEALPRILARLGNNAVHVTVRAIRAPEPRVPPGGPSGRYDIGGKDWRSEGGPMGSRRRRRAVRSEY
jgi:hypothetical protein